MPISASELFIVDNSDSDWKVRSYLSDWCDLSSAIDIATGYFEIGALLSLKEQWQKVDKIRLLMGDEVSYKTKRAFAEGLRKVTQRLDRDCLKSPKLGISPTKYWGWIFSTTIYRRRKWSKPTF